MKYLLSSAVLALAVSATTGASAVEITLIAPGGIRAAVSQMIPDFERKTGNTVKATFGSGGGTKAQVVKGDPFDVPVVGRAAAGQPRVTAVLGHVIALHRVADEGQDHQENHCLCHGTNYATVDIPPTVAALSLCEKILPVTLAAC